MLLEEYASYDATGLAALVRSGEVTPAELARCALEGVAKIDEVLGAVVQAFPERREALESAEPGAGPFAGVPTMLKDLFHGEPGTICENGSRLGHGWVVPSEAEFTARIRRSGLINLGRTTTSEFGVMGTTETLAAGSTCSPWSAEHFAGGSSGGAAAVVGAGIVPVASASDGGGSIRIPASACGVVGLKPSRGRVPWGPHIAEALSGWAVHFMVTRSVRDTAGLLDALSGPASGDPFVVAPPKRPFLQEVGAAVEPLRIAVCSAPWSGHEVDPEIQAATEASARVLAELGHEIVDVPQLFDWEPFLQAMTDIWAADAAHTVDEFARAMSREVSAETLEGATLGAVEYGRTVTAVQLMDALDVANGIARRMGWFFQSHDVMLTPTLGRTPAPLGLYDATAPMDLKDVFATWSPYESFLPVFNATGQPAISLPLQHSSAGLPIGMQFVARNGGEALLIRLAAQLEEALPWHHRRPPIHVAN
jgi:amidase